MLSAKDAADLRQTEQQFYVDKILELCEEQIIAVAAQSDYTKVRIWGSKDSRVIEGHDISENGALEAAIEKLRELGYKATLDSLYLHLSWREEELPYSVKCVLGYILNDAKFAPKPEYTYKLKHVRGDVATFTPTGTDIRFSHRADITKALRKHGYDSGWTMTALTVKPLEQKEV